MSTGLVVVVWLLIAVGCAALRPLSLDVPPGHRAVLGRLDVTGLGLSEGILELVKEDRTFEDTIHVSLGWREFAIALPPGRYLVTRLRAFKDSRFYPDLPLWDLKLAFDVGLEPAVYIGTLRFGARAGRSMSIQVLDEYEDTLRTLRTRYSDLPATAARSLLQPQ